MNATDLRTEVDLNKLMTIMSPLPVPASDVVPQWMHLLPALRVTWRPAPIFFSSFKMCEFLVRLNRDVVLYYM